MNDKLYRKSYYILLPCHITNEEANQVLEELHEGFCGRQEQSLGKKAARQGTIVQQ